MQPCPTQVELICIAEPLPPAYLCLRWHAVQFPAPTLARGTRAGQPQLLTEKLPAADRVLAQRRRANVVRAGSGCAEPGMA